jgi:hypothetical protein
MPCVPCAEQRKTAKNLGVLRKYRIFVPQRKDCGMKCLKTIFCSKWLRLTLWVLVGVIVSIVLLGTIVFNSGYVQNKIISMATDALSEELQTEVSIDYFRLHVLGQRLSICGVTLKDRQQRDMLKVEELWGNFRLLPLLKGRVVLKECRMRGLDLFLVKPKDGPANFQFLFEATKKDGGKKKKPEDNAFQLDLRHALAKDVHVRYNDNEYQLAEAKYTFWRDRRHIDIKGLNIRSDNHKPRRNTNKPHRGAFDAGHLDLTADMGIDILSTEKDSIRLLLTNCCAVDSVAGINLTDVRSDITVRGRQILLSDLVIQQTETRLDIPKAEIILPKDSTETLKYKTDSISGRVMLRDISKPFAPVLKHFSVPLNLKVSLDGTGHSMRFSGIHVDTDDKLLIINATGLMRDFVKSRDITFHFEVHDMVAKHGIKDKIINQFTGRKFLMNQVYALGVVKYHGSFDILWKKQQFRGLMNTYMGDIDFEFQLDGTTKYLTGRVSTDSVRLGDLFQLKKLGNIDCSATFSIDYSKQRTAEIRKDKGGKLPIGHVEADIRKVTYRNIDLKNIHTDINSDGAVAQGDVTLMGRFTDLMLQFSFTNTTEMHKMKVKPKLRFRKMVDN